MPRRASQASPTAAVWGWQSSASRSFPSRRTYSTADFLNAKHDHELTARKETVLNIDYRQHGIGTASCGPYMSEKYRFNEKEFSFAFRIKPYFSEDTSLDALY